MEERMIFAVYGYDYAPRKWGRHFDYNSVNRLYYIHSGTGGYEINGKRVPFEKGKIYLFPNMSDAITYSDVEDPILHSYCDFEILPAIISSRIFSYTPDENTLDRFALEIFTEGGKRATDQRLKRVNELREANVLVLHDEEEELFRSAVFYLIHRVRHGEKDEKTDAAVQAAIEHIYKNISEKITVEGLAANAFMSKGGFIKRFKKSVGCSPYAYLKKIRLNMAKYLREMGFSLEYIAEKVGYSDAVALLHAMKNQNNKKM